jgi:hypothetical protein
MTATSPTDRQPRRLPWQSAAIAVLLVGFLAAWGGGWIVVRDRVAAQSDYYLRAEQIELTPRPPWVHSDVKAEVLRDAGLDRPLSLLEDELARRLYEAFPLHPWIARVERVNKRYPARMTVDVVYRRPACMVEVHDRGACRGVYAVDLDGVVLPTADFSPLDAARLPLLRGIDTPPSQPGSPWGDERVLEGCRLAAALSDVWLELQLVSLAPLPRPDEALDEPHRYELATRSGSRVLWGLPAAGSAADKAIFEAKIARLRQSLAERSAHGAPPRMIHLEGLDALPLPGDEGNHE